MMYDESNEGLWRLDALQWSDVESHAFFALWKIHGKRPRIEHYRNYIRTSPYPPVKKLEEKWGSWKNACGAFETLHRSLRYPNVEYPDYLLGMLAGHAKLVHNFRKGRSHVRFISDDMEQLEIIRSMLDETALYPNVNGKPSQLLRCYDEPLVALWEALDLNDHPEAVFRPTIDFVRGYIETHSHLHVTTPGRKRLTIVGPLVPQCSDILVSLGATQTTVYTEPKKSYRMNIHSKSLKKIQDALYPEGCVYNHRIRVALYNA